MSGLSYFWRFSAKQKHGGCVAAPGKTAGMGVFTPHDACFMQIHMYLTVIHCPSLFPSQKGQIQTGFKEAARTCVCN